jgi:hypothetical protein
MSCKCGPECRKVYYPQPQLFSESIEGIPAGAGKTLSVTEIAVCTQCGQAEFLISDQDMQRHFRRAAHQNGNRVAVVRCCLGIIRTKAEGPIRGRACG